MRKTLFIGILITTYYLLMSVLFGYGVITAYDSTDNFVGWATFLSYLLISLVCAIIATVCAKTTYIEVKELLNENQRLEGSENDQDSRK